MAVSKRLRYEVLRRDQHSCRYCGQGAPDVPMTVDHVVPTTLGGSDEPSNLVAACKDCNAGKSASSPDAPLVADVDKTAALWARAMDQVLEQRALELGQSRSEAARFGAHWETWSDGLGEHFDRDADWKSTVVKFLEAGLDHEFLADAVDLAIGNRKIRHSDKWRYFCGICYRELDKIRERTAARLRGSKTGASSDNVARLPLGPGLDPSFDPLNLSDSFLADLMHQLRVPADAQVHAHRAYWAGMTEAYRVHMLGGCPQGVDRDDWVQEQFDHGTAHDMAALRSALGANNEVTV